MFNYPKIKSKSKVRIDENLENRRCLSIWVLPKIVFEPYPNPKNSPLRPYKDKNSPKRKSNSKVRIEGSIEDDSCLTILVDPKTFLLTQTSPLNSPKLPKERFKMTPKTRKLKNRN